LSFNLCFEKIIVHAVPSIPVTYVSVRKELPVPSNLKVTDLVTGHYKRLARMKTRLAQQHKARILLLREDTFGGMDADSNMCLIHALHSLGVPVVAATAGPHWALGDGNTMLKPFAKRLQHVANSTVHCGNFVLWAPRTGGCGHFTGMVITPASVVVRDGDTTDVFQCAADFCFSTDTVMYKLVSTASTSMSDLEDSLLATIADNREIASWA
jgi:hypothetical protein